MAVDREASQWRLDKLAAATLRHTPQQKHTVGDRIEEKAAVHPQRPFLLFDGRTLSYREFNQEANRVAHAALDIGFGTGDVVALMMENRPEYIVSWAGLAKLGVTVALLLRDVGAFDANAFYELTEDRLAHYAIPLFVRLVGKADMTSTFKLRKVDLQRDGYDLDRVSDPVFVRDETQRKYVRLSPENLPSRFR